MGLLKTLLFISKHPLNRKRKTKAILNFFKWQIGSRLVPEEVIFNWINGSKIIARKGETSVTGQIYCGLYTFSEMAFVLHVLTPEDLFIDVGSNIGCFTILACAVKGAKGYCFEPIPDTYDRLVENIRINNLNDRVKALNIGISDKDESLYFTTNRNATNLVIREISENLNVQSVKVSSLDAILSDESPTMLKIDVEGYETPVLNGALKILHNKSVNSLIIRLKGHGSRFGYDEREIFTLMKSYGFGSYVYDPFTRKLKEDDAADSFTGNAIFIRDLEMIKNKIDHSPKIKVAGIEI